MNHFIKCLVFITVLIQQVVSDCIMYGECGPANAGAVYNCKYTGQAKPMQQNASSLLKDICPHLYNGDNKTSTCCDYAQLKRLSDDMSLPRQLMSRCPACYRNFKAFLCDMTCGPNQSDFLLVTNEEPYIKLNEQQLKETKEKNALKQMQVLRYTYHITNYYTQYMFDSCK